MAASALSEETEQPGRFTFEIGGRIAELVFTQVGDRLWLEHTRVPPALGGGGVGARLVRAAVEYAASAELTIVPECDYARGWLQRNPDEASHVSIDWNPTDSPETAGE